MTTRELAAHVLAIAASNPDISIYSVIGHSGERKYLAAWDLAVSAYMFAMDGRNRSECFAEAEAMLRTGWSP